ncbi:hypothetical protein [Psychrobacillus lasiicapitis]|uniref:hypothetical protein n=1 Tax=Psychrobacillus lasiicapitis TaxID=1636719 RepID=UPI0019CBEB71|nr:hypothetical protein [Psychrobacillus lasiicapitis]GGA28359.1 hypothetical protein GCM10011384_17180 [Psychrobacillus lasiicapitis]
MLLQTILLLGLILNLPIDANSKYVQSSPKIEKFYTNIPITENWIRVPEETKEITIYVEAQSTETVLYWLIPTGTGQWGERKLIGYDIKDDGDNKFSLVWQIERPLLDHLEVQALGENALTNELLNIISTP